jgi:pyruvate dehydrogenase E1 component alpha subunit
LDVCSGCKAYRNVLRRYRKDVLHEDGEYAVTASFFGDGTCNVGQFYECLNMAALYKLPHIFVVENNKWAIGMSHARSTSVTAGDEYPYIYKKGPAFGMPSVYVDGMDVVKVRSVAKEAIDRARRGEGPTLIECETYRFRGHSLADPDELRSKDEKAAYNVCCQLPLYLQCDAQQCDAQQRRVPISSLWLVSPSR